MMYPGNIKLSQGEKIRGISHRRKKKRNSKKKNNQKTTETGKNDASEEHKNNQQGVDEPKQPGKPRDELPNKGEISGKMRSFGGTLKSMIIMNT